eukprot:COSAG06_NODE_1073_length_10819_cov_4.311847_7_plen_178_part_00
MASRRVSCYVQLSIPILLLIDDQPLFGQPERSIGTSTHSTGCAATLNTKNQRQLSALGLFGEIKGAQPGPAMESVVAPVRVLVYVPDRQPRLVNQRRTRQHRHSHPAHHAGMSSAEQATVRTWQADFAPRCADRPASSAQRAGEQPPFSVRVATVRQQHGAAPGQGRHALRCHLTSG